jgi:hypothetical protein
MLKFDHFLSEKLTLPCFIMHMSIITNYRILFVKLSPSCT